MTPLAPAAGTVYLITDGTHIKVGWTSSPVEKRLNELQTGNALELSVLATVEADKQVHELLLHCYLQQRGLWIRREWFLPCAELTEAFARNSHVKGVLEALGLSGAGERIALLRRTAELTPSETARLAGLNALARLDLLEREIQVLSSDSCERLGKLFGVTAEFILCGKGTCPDAESVKRAVSGAPGYSANNNAFGERLKSLRERTKYSQRSLSMAAGLSSALVRHYESGRLQSPSSRVVAALAGALGCHPGELFVVDPTPQPEPAQ